MRSPKIEPNIFNYDNYRIFLKDYFSQEQNLKKHFSMRQFCLQVGVTTENYFTRILRGQRNLGPKIADRLCNHLKFDLEAKHYFHLLLQLEQPIATESKALCVHKMAEIRRRRATQNLIRDNSIACDWQTMVILTLARCQGFSEDPLWIAKALKKRINVSQIRTSLEFLVSKGYLKKNGQVLTPTARGIETSEGVSDVLLRLNHLENLKLAMEALDWPVDERGNWGITLAISKSHLPEIKRKFRQMLIQLAHEIESANVSEPANSQAPGNENPTSAETNLDAVIRLGGYLVTQAETSGSSNSLNKPKKQI